MDSEIDGTKSRNASKTRRKSRDGKEGQTKEQRKRLKKGKGRFLGPIKIFKNYDLRFDQKFYKCIRPNDSRKKNIPTKMLK